MVHICVNNLTIIGSDNGLSRGRRQAIIWTNAGILLIGPLGTNFNEIFNRNSYIFIQENAFKTVVCEMAAILFQPQCVNCVHGRYLLFFGTVWLVLVHGQLRCNASWNKKRNTLAIVTGNDFAIFHSPYCDGHDVWSQCELRESEIVPRDRWQ